MRDTLREFLEKVKLNKRSGTRILTLICFLSLIVSLTVALALRQTGITMAGGASCGIEEHTHTTKCFNSHNICQKVEHIHTINCYSDENADTETALDWQKLYFQIESTDNYKENLVNFAKSQLGYKESDKNFRVDPNGNRHGYTRYGAWYGMPYSEWSAMFVSFCLNYSGSNDTITPYNLGAEAMRADWDNKNLYKEKEIYEPQVGDIIFIDEEGSGKSNKVAIITEVTQLYINTVEGDVLNTVCENTYKKDDTKILGYGKTPFIQKTNTQSTTQSNNFLATLSGINQNTQTDAFILNSAYQGLYNDNSPLGTAGSFHIVAFDTAYLKVHTNGNILAKNVYANSNFGTNSKNGVDLLELSYIQNYLQVNSGSSADTTDFLVLGSDNNITLVDNGNAIAINGTKLDKPKKSNIIIDANTANNPFIDMQRVENEIKSIASLLANYKNSDSSILEVNTTGSSPYLKITNKDNTAIYTFTAQEIVNLSKIGNGLSMMGFETGGNGAIIVNVDCKDWDENQTLTMPRSYVYVDGQPVNLTETLDFSAGKVIWNFINTARSGDKLLKIETNLMTGAVVAPDAHINLQLSFNGTAIGRVVENNSETHRTDFMGKIIPTGEVGGAYIDIYKKDSNNEETKLSGAVYTLYFWNGSSWEAADNIQTTNADGIAYFKGLTYNLAYMLKETTAPNGYVIDETPYYFYFNSTDTVKYPVIMPNDFNSYAEKNIFTKTFLNQVQIIEEYAPIIINKNWLNSSGIEEIPQNVNVNIELWRVSRSDMLSEWGNAEKIYDNIILNENIDWTWKAGEKELLSSHTAGTTTIYYAYYIVETSSIEGYAPSYNGITAQKPQMGENNWNIEVTNHKVETTSIEITKEWYQKDGSIMDMPPVTEIYVQIFASADNGLTWEKYGSDIEIKAEDNWNKIITNLPVKNPENQQTYLYTVQEIEIDNFSSHTESKNEREFIIKNTCEKEFTSIKVDKKWIRNGKFVNKSSGSINLELYQISGFGATGNIGSTDTVDILIQVGQWYFGNGDYQNKTYSVPIGTKLVIEYDFVPVDEGYELLSVVNGVSQKLTPVSKVENGVTSDNRTVYRITYEYVVTSNASLQGKLNTWVGTYSHKVNVTYEEPITIKTELFKTVTLNANNNWTYTFGNLPKYILNENAEETENQYYYYIVESNAQEYSPTYKDLSGNDISKENPIAEGTIIIENILTGEEFELPGTGGKGITPYLLTGLIVIVLSICCVYILKFIKKGYLL